MLRVRDYSISAKLTWMNMLVSGTALLLACAAFVAYDLVTFRETLMRNLSTQAQIVGANSVSALLFNDPSAAEKTLSALETSPNIVSAGIYTADGQPFAAYRRDHASQPVSLPSMPAAQSQISWFKDRQVVLVRPIMFQGRPTGTVYIRSNLHELIDRLKRYVIIVTAVLVASLLAALLTSSIFRRAIADPIVRLADTARTVSRDKIYSVRAPTTRNRDELAILIGTFNEMLAQIQERDTALQSEIAERTKTEKALETQTLMLQSVLDSMAEGLVAADEQGKFLIWNRAAERIVGYGPADLPAQEWSEHYGNYLPDGVTLVPTEQLPLVRAIHGETSATEIFLRNPKVAEGTWIEARGAPLKDQDGAVRGGVVAFRDITQRKADEREIQKLNDELEERVIQRTAALQAANQDLEAFTYSVSHDLRAPLRHISGFTRILVEEFGPSLPEGAQRHLQRIEHGAQRMGLLVDELLNLTRVGRQSLSVQVTGLGSIVKDVLSLLEPEAEGRKVEWKIADLPFVECDPNLIRQVFQNLISNALKYSRPRSPAVIEIGQTEKDGQQVIFVRDNGVGFSMKYADKLFGVFQRLHRPEDFEGTGVGLATVQRIVQKHGGRVWTEAELDKGATFYLTLGGFAQSCIQNAAVTAGG